MAATYYVLKSLRRVAIARTGTRSGVQYVTMDDGRLVSRLVQELRDLYREGFDKNDADPHEYAASWLANLSQESITPRAREFLHACTSHLGNKED